MRPSDYFLPHIARMKGYVPGEQPQAGGYTKLNTNENPYPPSPLVAARLRDACGDELRLYPDAEARVLRGRLAGLFGLAVDQVMMGNGSDELLNLIVRSFAGPGHKVVYPYPTYAYYTKLAQLQDAREVVVDFAEDFSLTEEIFVPDARLTLIANPNSPSGTLLSSQDIAALATRVQGLLVVDEAYIDFAEGGCLDLLARFPHLIVVRTMSKSFSLAGMRLGFCFAAPELIAGLWKVKDHYNLNRLGLVAAAAALEDLAAMQANVARIRATRARLQTGLAELGSRCGIRRPTSCWPVEPRRPPSRCTRSSRSSAFWSATSPSAASPTACASPWARTPRSRRSWPPWPGSCADSSAQYLASATADDGPSAPSAPTGAQR
jgi:histidinol-phosphate aminotransferase